jgi:hypothetical protein
MHDQHDLEPVVRSIFVLGERSLAESPGSRPSETNPGDRVLSA